MSQDTRVDEDKKAEATASRSRDADWPAVLFFIHIQLLSFYGLWLLVFEAKWMTICLCKFSINKFKLGATLPFDS